MFYFFKTPEGRLEIWVSMDDVPQTTAQLGEEAECFFEVDTEHFYSDDSDDSDDPRGRDHFEEDKNYIKIAKDFFLEAVSLKRRRWHNTDYDYDRKGYHVSASSIAEIRYFERKSTRVLKSFDDLKSFFEHCPPDFRGSGILEDIFHSSYQADSAVFLGSQGSKRIFAPLDLKKAKSVFKIIDTLRTIDPMNDPFLHPEGIALLADYADVEEPRPFSIPYFSDTSDDYRHKKETILLLSEKIGDFFKLIFSYTLGFAWFINRSYKIPSRLPAKELIVPTVILYNGKFLWGKQTFYVTRSNFWAIGLNIFFRNIGKLVGWMLSAVIVLPAWGSVYSYYAVKNAYIEQKIKYKIRNGMDQWDKKCGVSHYVATGLSDVPDGLDHYELAILAKKMDAFSFLSAQLQYESYIDAKNKTNQNRVNGYIDARIKVLKSKKATGFLKMVLFACFFPPSLYFTLSPFKSLVQENTFELGFLETMKKYQTSRSPYAMGKELLDNQSPQYAFFYLSRVRPDHEEYKDAMFECGSLLLASGQPAEAEEYFKKASALREEGFACLLKNNPGLRPQHSSSPNVSEESLIAFASKIQGAQASEKTSPEVIAAFNTLYSTLQKVEISKQPYPIIVAHFSDLADRIATGEKMTLAEIQASANELDRKLYGKPPLSKKMRIAMGGVIGAVVGLAIGIIIGGGLTCWAGGFGAIPATLLGMVKGFTIGTAIALGTTSAGLLVGGTGGLFSEKQCKKRCAEHIGISSSIDHSQKGIYTSLTALAH